MSQAEQCASWFSDLEVDRLMTSPLQRASQTAAAIGRSIGVDAVVDSRLRERMNWGDVPGQDAEEFQRVWRQTDEDRDRSPYPGAPSARQAGERLADLMSEDGGPVVLVAHGGVLQSLADNLAEQRGEPLRKLKLAHCSITRFNCHSGTVRLTDVGSCPWDKR